MATTTNKSCVDFKRLSDELARNSSVQQKVSPEEPVIIKSGQLLAKVKDKPDFAAALELLGAECAIARISVRETEEGVKYYADTLSLFVDFAGQVNLFDAALSPVPGAIKYLEYSLKDRFQRVEIEGQLFDVDLRLSEEGRGTTQKGKGKPDAKFIKNLPAPGVPMKALKQGVIYRVLEQQGISDFGTPRYLAQELDGEEAKPLPLYSNQDLERLIAQKGLPCEFEIYAAEETERGTVVKVRSPESGEALDKLELF